MKDNIKQWLKKYNWLIAMFVLAGCIRIFSIFGMIDALQSFSTTWRIVIGVAGFAVVLVLILLYWRKKTTN